MSSYSTELLSMIEIQHEFLMRDFWPIANYPLLFAYDVTVTRHNEYSNI